jgi:hypothetical protein
VQLVDQKARRTSLQVDLVPHRSRPTGSGGSKAMSHNLDGHSKYRTSRTVTR